MRSNDLFNINDCLYYLVCNRSNTDDCGASCVRYMEMSFMFDKSLIPNHYRKYIPLVPADCDLGAFERLQDVKENILDFVNKGKNLYIHSNNLGNGKTTWAIKLLKQYFDKKWLGNGFKIRGMFIHVPTFLTKTKNAITYKDIEIEEIKNNLDIIDLVVWDDIGTTKLTDYDNTLLLTHIDTRILNNLSNIYTGNLNEVGLEKAVGKRLASRIWKNSISVQLLGIDQRGRSL